MGRAVRAAIAVLAWVVALPVHATFHLWTMNELYSNADGSVQFLELTALAGGQEFMTGHTVVASGGGGQRTFTFPNNLPADSANRRMLIGTQGFAALGIVTPDYVVPNGFFTVSGGQITFAEGFDSWTYGPLPSGNLSLNRDGTTGANSPRNFAGATGTVPAPGGGGGGNAVSNFNVHGMWWRGVSESGWGMNLVHQGNTVFATWFTYDIDGSDLWLVMDNLQLTGTDTWSGTVYRTSGSPFGLTPYDNARFAATPVGTATFTFTDANNGSVTWTVNGTTLTKPITKFVYQTNVPTCTKGAVQSDNLNYQDLWWRSPALSENGVGYNILHQGDILFVTWFTYDTDGSQMWLFMDSANKTSTGVYTGDVKQARGSPVNQTPYNTTAFAPTTVGTGTLTFSGANSGTFTYTVKGVTQTKPIIRFTFSSPVTTCVFAPTMGNPGYPTDPYPP